MTRQKLWRAIRNWWHRYWNSFSFVGLVFAALFFAASVTPSLLPRTVLAQGLLSGFALAFGYGIGILAVWLWQFLELPDPNPRLETISKRISTVGTAIVFIGFLRQMTFWQNSIHELMKMPPLESADPYRTALLAVVFGALLIAFTRLILNAWHFVAGKINLFLPRRISYALGTLIVGFLFIQLVNGVLAKNLLRFSDRSFEKIDALIDEGVEQPIDPAASGSNASLINWDSIGRRGKNFVVSGPTAQEISDFTLRPARQPLRVYVGLRSRETMREQAQLALEELKRVGGFDRQILVVATPTGTGWLDPSAVDTLEYLHDGNTAIVSMQYSYLPSWLTIAVDPEGSRMSARTLFDEVYDYWKTLPKDKRPRLYLHGLSLGALGSESCADLFTILEDPIQGAVWSGPPFPSPHWATLTAERNAGTEFWLPEFQDGAMVRFTGQANSLDTDKRWGPIRSVYLQYASDPMVFFSTDLPFRKPEWLNGHRGPDVSPHLQWYPIVTSLQIAFDLPMATSVPMGYGHNYAPAHYINAWLAVTAPERWNPADTPRLKELFADRVPESF